MPHCNTSRACRAFRAVDLSDTKVTDTGLQHLSRLTQLEKLSLDRTGVTDGGLEHLQELPRLKAISLCGAIQVTDAALEYVGAVADSSIWTSAAPA